MKKIYTTLRLGLLGLLLMFSANSNAQTFSAWGTSPTGYAFDTCDTYGDTMRISFSGLPAGAHGMAKLVVYYEGDFGDNIESAQNIMAATPFGASLSTLGTNGPCSAGIDCSPEDSTVIYFNTSLFVSLGSSFSIKNIPNNNVDFFCTVVRVRMRLEFNYCAFGTPVQYANASLSNAAVCPYETATLMGLPAGGSWAGPGVSGSTFDPSSLPAGNYTLTYTGTDAIGCTTTDDTIVRVMPSPQIPSYTVCYGDTATVVPANSDLYIYSTDPGMTTIIDTANKLDYGPLSVSETIYAVNGVEKIQFQITALTGNSPVTVDQYPLMNDDRGGIAITPNFVYVVGDDYTVRHDISLVPGTGIQLPQRDGIFSDLYSGRLYTLYNTTAASDPTFAPGTFTVDALMEMDDMLNFTGTLTYLSTPITLDYDSKIFAGAGIVIFYSIANDHFYVVNLGTGSVNDLGVSAGTFNMFSTENWLDWGIAEYDGTDYSIVYRDDFGSFISRMNLSTGVVTTVATFTDLADMASITYSRWENKWYWKYEYAGEFGGSDEVCGKVDGSAVVTIIPAGGGCYTAIDLTVPTVEIGSDVYFCQGDEAEFSISLGYSSVSWNGNNSNLNTYSTTTSEQVIIEAVDATSGCLAMDTANAVMNPLPVVTLNLTDDHACITQTTFPLTGGTPAGGVYSGGFVSGSNFNATSAGNGTHIVSYTYVDANGCVNFAQDAVFVDACVGIDELGNNLVSVYPNPANNTIVINAGSFVSQPVSIDIYDVQGKVVYTEKTTLVNNHSINVSALENGVYHIILSVDNNRSVGKLVIQK